MSIVNIINVTVLDNPTAFSNPFQFEIQFECLQELEEDLDFKVIYVGSAEDEGHDQTLEDVSVGPVVPGVHRFVLQAPAPNPALIPNHDLIGVTVVLLTCSYVGQEFIRIGYYVNNEYTEPYDPENPPAYVDPSLLLRNLLADQPRVTRFAINWSGTTPEPNAVSEVIDNGDKEVVVDGDDNADDELEGGDGEAADDEDDGDEEDDEDDEDAEIDIEDDEEMSEDDDDEGDDDDEAEEVDECDTENMQLLVNEDSMDVLQMQGVEGAFSNGFSKRFP